MKKLFAAFLAIVMCMALAVPAFASTPPANTTQYDITLKPPTIEVTVPAAAIVKLNPYQIKVTLEDIGAEDATGSILAGRMYLANKSDVPLKMSLVASGSIPSGSNAAFSSSPLDPTEKNRKVFMFIQVGAVTEGPVPTDPALSNVTYSATDEKQGVIKAGDLKMDNVQTITVPDDADDGNYVPIDVGGACATTPTEAWTEADVVGLTIAVTFVATNNATS
jgi:hypothetical protein